jgi:hypothetical protein
MALSFQMEPGDFQLVNNYCVLHARTNFEDYAEPDRRRHLLRLWLATPNSRELPPVFEKRFGSCKGGAVRGGIPPRRNQPAATGSRNSTCTAPETSYLRERCALCGELS